MFTNLPQRREQAIRRVGANRLTIRDNRHVKTWTSLLAVAALTMAPSALAKGPDTARICGSSGCVTASTPEKVNVLALYTSGFAARDEPAAAPFFTVKLTSTRAEDVDWSFIYVPSAKTLQIVEADFSDGIYDTPAKNQWVTPSAGVVAAYETATEALSPFPASNEWTATSSGDRDVPWVIGAWLAAAAALIGLLLLSRRILMRRAARLAHR